MFRRRNAPTIDPVVEPEIPKVGAAALAEAGWSLPRGIDPSRAPSAPSWTLVGTVGSPTATPVDEGGFIVGSGWGLDWWIGADDRWHVPARESAVRQDLLSDVPVVETLVRIPGGDAVGRAYGMRSPRRTGDEWVISEVQNATPVPFGIALVIRPFMADGIGAIGSITIEPVDGGTGRDVAHLVRVDGRPALVVPRRPSRLAVGNHATGDVLDVVTSGEAGSDLQAASCPDGLATMALIFPLAHTATIRVAIPVGEVDPDETVAYPTVLPDAATVASGWDIHLRGPRFEIPNPRLHQAVARAKAQVLLAHDGEAVRRDGASRPELEPGATDAILGAFDLLDRVADVGLVVTPWQGRLADPGPEVDTIILGVVARHWLLHRIDAMRDWMLPEMAAAVERIDRADKRGRLDALAQARAVRALRLARQMFAASGQPEAADAISALADRIDAKVPASIDPGDAAEELMALSVLLQGGDGEAAAALDALVARSSATSGWPTAAGSRRPLGHDLAASAALVTAARGMLIDDGPDGLALLPVYPDGWYGAGVEVHDAPTAWGTLSFAIRWHGLRPALLWDLEPHEGLGPVTITVPSLDPAWSTTEARGDGLLAVVKPPKGIDLIREVAEHPDIDPVMRKPGEDPGAIPSSLPDGGTFS